MRLKSAYVILILSEFATDSDINKLVASGEFEVLILRINQIIVRVSIVFRIAYVIGNLYSEFLAFLLYFKPLREVSFFDKKKILSILKTTALMKGVAMFSSALVLFTYEEYLDIRGNRNA